MSHGLKACGGELTVELDPRTMLLKFSKGSEVVAAARPPRFALAGKPAEAREAIAVPGGFDVRLAGEGVSGMWRVRSDALSVISTIEAAGVASDVAVEIELPLPLSAAIELPVGTNWGLRATMATPVGKENGRPLGHNSAQLAAVEVGGRALAFIGLSNYTRYLPGTYANVWKEGAWRDEDALWLHLGCVSGVPFEVSVQPDLEGVIDRYCRVLRERLGILQKKDDPSVPAWLDEIRVILNIPMWRSNGDILNDFSDTMRLAADLKAMGARGSVMVRLTGVQAPFDSGYPIFDPAKELGGPAGMKTLSAALHVNGNRLSQHLNMWGIDPYLESFEAIEHLAVPYDRVYERIPTGQIGPYDGWPGPYPAVPTGYDTGVVPLEFTESGPSHAVFQTGDIPHMMEAYLTVTGVGGLEAGRLRAIVGRRQVTSAPGTFVRDNRCRFRFRFRFAPGRNTVRLEALGGRMSWTKPSYRLNGSVRGERLWSNPIVRADINHPQWTQITRDNLGRNARENGLDIVYLDAVNIWRPSDAGIFNALRADMPDRVVFGCEYPAELGLNMFRTTQATVGGWAPKGEALETSDFARRIRERFMRIHYLHHFAEGPGVEHPIRAFELFGSESHALMPWAMAEGPSKGVIKCSYVDYRKTGLDEPTRRLVMETAQ